MEIDYNEISKMNEESYINFRLTSLPEGKKYLDCFSRDEKLRVIEKVKERKEYFIRKGIEAFNSKKLLDIDLFDELKKDKKRLFKKFILVNDIGCQKLIYNDGSDLGIEIVSLNGSSEKFFYEVQFSSAGIMDYKK